MTRSGETKPALWFKRGARGRDLSSGSALNEAVPHPLLLRDTNQLPGLGES